jgi:hypothetical protein
LPPTCVSASVLMRSPVTSLSIVPTRIVFYPSGPR